ncbi:MAG: hypothetical protein V1854_04935 [Methanobacteriota archaeon]
MIVEVVEAILTTSYVHIYFSYVLKNRKILYTKSIYAHKFNKSLEVIYMVEITGIWTGFDEAHVLGSNGIDTLVDARGNAQIRVEGQTLPGGK